MKGKRFIVSKKQLNTFTFVYVIFYLIAFFALESREEPLHIIHCWLDDLIPFCEYFVIPYFLWFLYLIGTGIYFLFYCDDIKECEKFIFNICTGMTVFLVVSYIYPNGHELRPILENENIFTKIVEFLHWVDTPTNILPSMHVYATVACSIALIRQQQISKNRLAQAGIFLISIAIIASTLFLKQHSVIDVITALGLNVICYVIFYAIQYRKI